MVDVVSRPSTEGGPAAVRAGWALLLPTLPFLTAYTVFPLTIVAAVKGGLWVVLPFWTTISVLDLVVGDNRRNLDKRTPRKALLFSDLLVWLWVPTQAAMYVVVFYQFFYSDHLALWEKSFVLFAAGRATALGLTVGHELSHRRSRWEKYLGECVMSFAGLGHYSTEHIYVHHTRVATPHDPATARKGESLYRFIARSWIGNIAHAWRVDRERLRRRGVSMWHRSNPWWRYSAVLLFLAAAAWSAAAFGSSQASGWHGVAVYAGVIFVANVTLRGVDYIEHYGLLRTYTGRGRFEPIAPRHSWDSARRISSWAMFNVQRHADHHYKPARPYLLLQTHDENQAHQMPFNYVTMYLISMVPPLWRRIIHPRLEAWRRQYYPRIEDWAAYDSPLFYEYPEKYPVIAEVMANDARLSDWMHRHPAVLEGKYTPEQAHLSLADADLGDEWEEIAQRGLVNVFYRKELTPRELEEQLADLTQGAESADDAAAAIRPWLEDQSFQLGLHRLRGHLDPETATAAFTAIVEAAVLCLAGSVDRELQPEFDAPEFDEPAADQPAEDAPAAVASAADAPAVFALGPLARSDMTMGDVLALTVESEPAPGEGAVRAGADLRRFQNDWTTYFIRGLRRLFHNDFPCRFAGTLAVPAGDAEPDRRRLRP